jgi:hypothetical protein
MLSWSSPKAFAARRKIGSFGDFVGKIDFISAQAPHEAGSALRGL